MNKPNDHLYWRRLLTLFGLGFSLFWFFMVFWTDVFVTFDVAKVIAYLGVPATISGLGFYKYLKACEKDDDKN